MKKILVLLALVLTFAFNSVSAQKNFHYEYFDTLDNAVALTYTIDPSFLGDNVWDVSFTLQADSVSGGTAGLAYIQVSNWATGNYWHTISTTTINGVQTLALVEDEIRFKRMRLYVTGGGTQRTFVRLGVNGVRKL
jgi:hypothetical protein